MALAKISSAPTVPEIIALVNQIIDEKLGVNDKAADSDKLDGQDSAYFATATALADKLDKTAQAADSAKLGGTAAASFAKLASPAFTGTPTAPTAASTTNSTQIATTAFVKSLVGAANNGGIIAASLAQNGYVKFANGLILQWGKYTQSSTLTFPVAFTSAVYAYLHSGTLPPITETSKIKITLTTFWCSDVTVGNSWKHDNVGMVFLGK